MTLGTTQRKANEILNQGEAIPIEVSSGALAKDEALMQIDELIREAEEAGYTETVGELHVLRTEIDPPVVGA